MEEPAPHPRTLAPLEYAVLEHEAGTFSSSGAKISAFRDIHPEIGPIQYTRILLRLLQDPLAWEVDNGRFAPTLARIRRLHEQRMTQRGAARGVVPE